MATSKSHNTAGFLNMGLEENKAIIRRLLQDGLAKQDKSVLDELIAAKHVRDEWELKFGSFPDLELRAEHMIAEGDEVWTRGTFRATHVRDFGRYVASGKFVELPYIDWWVLRDGKIVDNWGIWDNRQLLLPRSG